MPGKVIVRVKGGLGNQLSAYAAARRLTLVNDAELAIDHRSGFVRDRTGRRKYELDGFRIPVRKATSRERLEPFERYRRALAKWRSRRRPFANRDYVEQERRGLDERLLTLKVEGALYLDGIWHGEGYFKDVEATIRDDLRFHEPSDDRNRAVARQIRARNAVAVHVRWMEGSFDLAPATYYLRAFDVLESRDSHLHYFVFSDDPEAARNKLCMPEDRTTIVSCNSVADPCADMWLISGCRHFVIANSTFSWWAAWVGSDEHASIVISPSRRFGGRWADRGQIPEWWLRL